MVAHGISALLFAFIFLILSGCRTHIRETEAGREPVIHPDYNQVTVPINIAPLNFIVSETGDQFIVHLKTDGEEIKIISHDSIIDIPLRKWKKLLKNTHGTIELWITARNDNNLKHFEPIFINVAPDEIDPYVCYRLLYPGYESWGEMQIIQRSVENFRQHKIADNKILDGSCINCHTFLHSDTEKYFFHVRGNKAGTYFVDNEKITRLELRTDSMPGNAVYPSWHPSGRYIAFSSNRIHSVINMKPENNVEMYDRAAILILYDMDNNSISPCNPDSGKYYLSTYPCWSPDGRYLYFCRTEKAVPGFNYRDIMYNLYRMSFNPETGIFGIPEQIFNAKAISKSISFPVISPNGRFLIFTMHNYGTFPGWHNEADLHSLDLVTLKEKKLSINSVETESFATWSSDGKWLAFSSKRDDGFYSRLYFAYFKEDGSTGKPFILPELDPSLSGRLNKSYNRPQMVKARIKNGPRNFEKASRKVSKQAQWTKD